MDTKGHTLVRKSDTMSQTNKKVKKKDKLV